MKTIKQVLKERLVWSEIKNNILFMFCFLVSASGYCQIPTYENCKYYNSDSLGLHSDIYTINTKFHGVVNIKQVFEIPLDSLAADFENDFDKASTIKSIGISFDTVSFKFVIARDTTFKNPFWPSSPFFPMYFHRFKTEDMDCESCYFYEDPNYLILTGEPYGCNGSICSFCYKILIYKENETNKILVFPSYYDAQNIASPNPKIVLYNYKFSRFESHRLLKRKNGQYIFNSKLISKIKDDFIWFFCR